VRSSFRRRWSFVAFVLLGMVSAAACDSPNQPTPPQVQNLTLACPASQQLDDVIGAGHQVTWPNPAVAGGTPPTTVTCQPASGATFPLGPTTVSCTARDSANRTAFCAFSVNLAPVPVISATKFLAFGDSLTAGEVELTTGAAGASKLAVDPNVAYPTVIRNILQARYKGQSISVVNAGQSGESAVKGADRISGVLLSVQPEVLILLQGVIDLSQGGAAALPDLIEALKFDIRDAKRRGVQHVFVSTLLPQKPGALAFAMDLIVPANDEIRQLVAAEGARLLDGYAALAGMVGTLIGADGLHPVAAGYDVLGTFYANEIMEVLELPPPSVPLGGLLRRPGVEVGAQTAGPPVRLQHRKKR
jgi:lysophospholipase L1-like esterase